MAGKSGPLQWMLGGNYAHDTAKDDQWGDYYGSNTGVGPQRFSTFINSNHQKVRTAAAFGSLDYEIVPSVTARASARYTDHKDSFAGCLRDNGDGQLAAAFGLLVASTAPGGCATFSQTTFTAVPIVTDTLKQHNFSWRAGVDWKPANDALVYANITRGFKAGSYPTVPGLFPEQFAPVTQERVTAYETGFKLSELDRKVQLTGAAFYYQYRDKQIIGYIDTVFGKVPSLVQIPRSKITGFELAMTARPASGLTLNGGVTYVYSKIQSSQVKKGSTITDAIDAFGGVVDLKGEQFPSTPKWQLNGDIDYSYGMSSSMDLALGLNVRYQSGSPATFGHSAGFDIPGYALVDLRGGVEAPDGKWKIQMWGRNIFNKFYVNSITHVTDTIARTAGMGATYGATTSFRF